MIIFTMQNVAWPNYYRSLVNIILDNKAPYVYKHKNEKVIKIEISTSFSKKISCFVKQKTNALHINRKVCKITKHVEVSDL